ncbi:MAG: 1-acyl-sn-glycerol-3-phosphate acyltransferase [Thiomargarita sp.]|nr:1-acyl-sn-glycerol-3-phosphate acyltransferase [Thiomargarita sp.]
MNQLLRLLFYKVIVKFVVLIVLGLNVRHREKLPKQGPAILVANHNSHLDTMVLMSLFPTRLLATIQPVAAMDYFLRNRLLAWFALKIVGILPIKRTIKNRHDNPLLPCYEALANQRILILFPEGSRGEPEKLANFKGGIAKLAEQFPDVPVIPILLHGLGKSLPKGEALLVPFFCDVFIGDPMFWTGNKKTFIQKLKQSMEQLATEGQFSAWD